MRSSPRALRGTPMEGEPSSHSGWICSEATSAPRAIDGTIVRMWNGGSVSQTESRLPPRLCEN